MKQILAITLISFAVIALLAIGGYWFIQREAAKGEEPETDADVASNPEAQVIMDPLDACDSALPEEMIEELLAIVEDSTFKDKAFYRNTLEGWRAGDFSGAVDVHNTIWHWHGGTIGKATRLLIAEEEQAYIRTHLR